MKRIEHNNSGPHLPFTMPPVVLPIQGDPVHPLVTFQHEVLPDPMFDHPRNISPGMSNFEDIIVMPDFHAYDHDWMQSLECRDTYNAIDHLFRWPVAPTTGAPIDVNGYPMTHHYDRNDRFVPHGNHPAFFKINRDNPVRNIPSNLVFQRWPTGPDQRIVDSNPLYQFARPNVPIPDDELRDLPDIHGYNDDFTQSYSLRPNMFAAIFRNQVNHKTDLFRTNAQYHLSPPNMNGVFSVLHHNFYPSTYLGDVYGIPSTNENAFDLEEQYNVLPEGEPHPWLSMRDNDIVELIDGGFRDCFTTAQRVSLWNHFLPLILRYQMTFCSLCCCRLPEFYFTKSQRRRKRTERACVHCDRNRQIKIGQVTQILGAAGYFVSPRECVACNQFLPKYRFTRGRWRSNDNDRTCLDCTH